MRTINGPKSMRYLAHAHTKGLRFYTRKQADPEVALAHQAILLRLRHALTAASASDPSVWIRPEELRELCEAALRASGTSEAALGLSIFVHLRAARWLGPRSAVVSPVLPLAEALATHARLLRARRASWEALRAEWVPLLARRGGISLNAAEAAADEARRRAAGRGLERAVQGAEQELDRVQDRAARVARARAAEKHARDAAVAASERRALRVRKQLWLERKRRLRGRDLTTEDLLYGPQLHLQEA